VEMRNQRKESHLKVEFSKPELEQEVYRYISLISFSKEVKT